MKTLKIKITTESNLYIGGMPKGFEIGGIDMQTVQQDNKPYIPASSFKGALREICVDNVSANIINIYKNYNFPNSVKQKFSKHLFIFGIPGINRSPKLIFTDFILAPDSQKDLFSIDMKNSIEEVDENLLSNPRTYRVARRGLTFEGKIIINFDLLNLNLQKNSTENCNSNSNIEVDKAEEIVEKYLKEMCNIFNEGSYRIGNSKSRGYGHISVKVW